MEAKRMKMVPLKNGSEEPDKLVKATILSLDSLMESLPIVFLAFVEFCRNPQNQISEKTKEIVKKRSLLEDNGAIHSSVKNIVLCSVEGEGLDMKLSSPIAS